MGKKATKKATAQLQKLFNYLGEFGGVIKTNNPGMWWDIDMEVVCIEDNTKYVKIGVCSSIKGYTLFDPHFFLSLKMENGKIVETEIKSYISQTVIGSCEIDGDDIFYGFGIKEKDPYGLKRRFSSFMHNMVEFGPYLTDPKSVMKYDKTLAD